MFDSETFVKSILASMWMLNDLPAKMRKDLDSQLGVIWLLASDKKCFPTLTFTSEQQQAICRVLEECSDKSQDFKFTYEAMLNNEDLKVKGAEVAGNQDSIQGPSPFGDCSSTSSNAHEGAHEDAHEQQHDH